TTKRKPSLILQAYTPSLPLFDFQHAPISIHFWPSSSGAMASRKYGCAGFSRALLLRCNESHCAISLVDYFAREGRLRFDLLTGFLGLGGWLLILWIIARGDEERRGEDVLNTARNSLVEALVTFILAGAIELTSKHFSGINVEKRVFEP